MRFHKETFRWIAVAIGVLGVLQFLVEQKQLVDLFRTSSSKSTSKNSDISGSPQQQEQGGNTPNITLIAAETRARKNATRNATTTTTTTTTLASQHALPPPPPRRVPKRLNFASHYLRFLHMGKAGGGTVALRLRHAWQLNIVQCHPQPCIEAAWKKSNNATTDTDTTTYPNFTTNHTKLPQQPKVQQQHPLLLLTLRDPVDRFLSAFYWRMMRLCHPEWEKQQQRQQQQQQLQQLPSSNTSTTTLEYKWDDCWSNDVKNKNSVTPEYKVLFQRYKGNPSLLAEALCWPTTQVDGDAYDNDGTNTSNASITQNHNRYQKATQSLGMILHAQYSITDWLDFAWNASLVFPLVVAPSTVDSENDGISVDNVSNENQDLQLEEQLDKTMYLVYKHAPFTSLENFFDRATYAKTRTVDDSATSGHRHSLGNSRMANPQISKQGRQCLEEYYQKDYELLKVIQNSACKTKGCHQAIQKILDSRQQRPQAL